MDAPERIASQTADESNRADRGSSVNNIRLVGMDQPFFTALAVAISVISLILAFFAFQELTAATYWIQRSETFLETLSDQGVHVPNDLLHKEH